MYSSDFELMLEQCERVLDDAIQINQLEFACAGAGEVQQAVNDLGSSECLLRDFFENRGTPLVGGRTQPEFVEIVNARRLAHAVVLLDKSWGEDFAQGTSQRLSSRLGVHDLHLRVPGFHPIR